MSIPKLYVGSSYLLYFNHGQYMYLGKVSRNFDGLNNSTDSLFSIFLPLYLYHTYLHQLILIATKFFRD